MEMKQLRFVYPDCEHEGDVRAGKEIVLDAIAKVNCTGHITKTHWSGEDGDYAYIYFSVPADKEDDVKKATEAILNGED